MMLDDTIFGGCKREFLVIVERLEVVKSYCLVRHFEDGRLKLKVNTFSMNLLY